MIFLFLRISFEYFLVFKQFKTLYLNIYLYNYLIGWLRNRDEDGLLNQSNANHNDDDGHREDEERMSNQRVSVKNRNYMCFH